MALVVLILTQLSGTKWLNVRMDFKGRDRKVWKTSSSSILVSVRLFCRTFFFLSFLSLCQEQGPMSHKLIFGNISELGLILVPYHML